MNRPESNLTETEAPSRSDNGRPARKMEGAPQTASPELLQAQDKLNRARQRMLSAAIAFCDGLISAGQMRAVREMLREQELTIADLGGEPRAPFVDPESEPVAAPPPSVPVEPLPDSVESAAEGQRSALAKSMQEPIDEELRSMLGRLSEKNSQLELDFQQGRINASQYRAIRRHYLEQHEVALRLHQANPSSDRWRVVLEEGKTTFLMQLNEAECRCIAFYDVHSRECVFVQGTLPDEAQDAMRFLSTFGKSGGDQPSGRMFATQTDDGLSLLLIPGRYTASLVAFSEEPPGWQVRALREVLRNFEAANNAPLSRGELESLVFPNLDRFFRE
ncbi:MAG: hypothetical protein WBR18_10730 [Anaerolineales bacterium]